MTETERQALLEALRSAPLRTGAYRGDPAGETTYHPTLTLDQLNALIALVEYSRAPKSRSNDIQTLRKRLNDPPSEYLTHDEAFGGQSYADRADSATTFDPEEQFDRGNP
jgi:hypothetical protein